MLKVNTKNMISDRLLLLIIFVRQTHEFKHLGRVYMSDLYTITGEFLL